MGRSIHAKIASVMPIPIPRRNHFGKRCLPDAICEDDCSNNDTSYLSDDPECRCKRICPDCNGTLALNQNARSRCKVRQTSGFGGPPEIGAVGLPMFPPVVFFRFGHFGGCPMLQFPYSPPAST